MRAVLFAVAGMLAVGAVHSASAADKGPPLVANAPVPFFDWTGFYVGGNVGGGQGQVRSSDTVSGTLGGLPPRRRVPVRGT